ncbi:MAG: hypothetical protein M3198_12105 [Actinomycetota bacterium]|nr:hypothetical protein [Actinomycetota bacterium]
MKPALKKILTAIAIKQVVDRVQERRQAKRRKAPGLVRAVLLAGAASGVYFAYKTGRLQALVKSRTGGRSSGSASTIPQGSPGGDAGRSSNQART